MVNEQPQIIYNWQYNSIQNERFSSEYVKILLYDTKNIQSFNQTQQLN